VWVLVAGGAVLVGLLLPPAEAIGWLPIVLALGMLVAFTAQLALGTVEGLVTRLALTASGAIVLLVLATAVLWLVAQ
jgi:hypothetical protein